MNAVVIIRMIPPDIEIFNRYLLRNKSASSILVLILPLAGDLENFLMKEFRNLILEKVL